MRYLTSPLVLALALVLVLVLAPAAGAYNDDPGGSVLPACGSNEFYTLYNFDHTVWTCLQGSWYFAGAW